jgi:hypothetical protein
MNNPATIAIIVTVVFLADSLLAVALVRWIVRSLWIPLQTRYPGADAAPDAVRRNFQSFRIGLASLGWLVHVTVDDDHLHLDPARVLRWVGAERISVPWNAMELVAPPRGRWATVRLERQRIVGPAWCLSLVAPAEDAADES